MRVLTPLFALLFAASLAGSAAAQSGQVESVFKSWDKDGDGALSRREWLDAGRQEEGFARVDANGDGKLTLEELKAAMARMQRGG